jgi:3-ketosteroid 9alpha-monooxygenase subunit B
MAAAIPAHVTAIEEVIPGVLQLTLAVDDTSFRFAPGQSLTLHLGEVRRTYSIASAPERPSAVQLCIRLGSGPGSVAVRGLRPGDALDFSGPVGEFTPPAGAAPIVLVAGDTGISPVRSIVLHLGATGDRRPLTVLYEPEGEELYPTDLRGLAEAGRVSYSTGKVEELIAGAKKVLRSAEVMVAGYQPFLERVEHALIAAGVAPERVRYETFGRL